MPNEQLVPGTIQKYTGPHFFSLEKEVSRRHKRNSWAEDVVIKYLNMRRVGARAQSTFTYSAPCMSPRRYWDSPTPSHGERVYPPDPKGGHTRLRVRGWGSPNTDDRRKRIALCLLCGRGKHTRYHDDLSPTEVSPKVFPGTMSLLDNLSLWLSVHDRCVPG
jgi:hypothetical protein